MCDVTEGAWPAVKEPPSTPHPDHLRDHGQAIHTAQGAAPDCT